MTTTLLFCAVIVGAAIWFTGHFISLEIRQSRVEAKRIFEALTKISTLMDKIDDRHLDIQRQQLKLSGKVAEIRNDELRLQAQEMVASGARVLDD